MAIAEVFGNKLNQATAPVIFLFPVKGWSAVDHPSSHMYDSEQDRLFLSTLKKQLSSEKIVVREVDANLEDQAFSDAVAEACTEIFRGA